MNTAIISAIKRSAWAPITVFVFHVFISVVFHAYYVLPSIDIPMHFLGGLVMAYFFYAIFQALGKNFLALSVFTAVGTTAIFWEFLEFLTHSQGDVPDTMLDMLMGLLGAVVFLALNHKRGNI